ncbi:MAG: hypothetical protein DMF06_03475 [Verrucomicrobia bacterium]|nr:MAG: hypothetical protein DMF06_03475 [Verrucomicrobiota bacterium]
MALIMTLERVADKVDEANKAANKRIAALEEQVAALEEQVAALTANTAQEPSTPADAVGPVTVETVEIVQDGSKTVMDETAKPKGKGGKNDA